MTSYIARWWCLFLLHVLVTLADNSCDSSEPGRCSFLDEGDVGSFLQAYSRTDAEEQLPPSDIVGRRPRNPMLFESMDGIVFAEAQESSKDRQATSALQEMWKKLKSKEKWGVLELIILMGSALAVNHFQGEKRHILITLVLWGASSVTMNVVNKIALVVIPLPMTLLAVQMLIATFLLLVFFGPVHVLTEIRENHNYMARWSCLASMFSAGLVTSILAFQHGSVLLILVVRNLMPLLTLVIERQVMPNFATVITWEAVFALSMLAIGTALYAFVDLRDSGTWSALGYIILNMIVMIAYRLAERYLLLAMPQTISFGSLFLVQNLAGLPPILGLLFLWGEHRAPSEWMVQCYTDPMAIATVVFSGCAGLTLGYYSIVLQKEITATSMLAAQSSTKLMTMLFAVLVLGEHFGLLSLAGCMISLAGATWYSFVIHRHKKPPCQAESDGQDGVAAAK